MEQVITTEASFLQGLLTHPLTYIVGIAILLVFMQKKMQKSSPKPTEANKTSSPSKPKRVRKKGKFVGDDPSTPQNEAWEGGKAPKKKAAKKKTATRKRAPKKSGS